MRPITRHRWLRGAAALVFIASAACKDSTGPGTGAVQVTVTTTGAEPDPNGYSVTVDGAAGQAIPINGAVTLSGLGAGGHSVLLAGFAPNCATGGGANPRPVAVVAGAAAQVAFSVTCVGTTGSLIVTIGTTGTDLDPDGYSLSVDGGAGEAVAVNGAVTVSGLSAGGHSVLLAGFAPNCVAAGAANPRPVDVVADATVQVAFAITCAASFEIALAGWTVTTDLPWTLLRGNGIYITSSNSGSRLTTGGDEPAWSHDGTKLAFAANGGISVMNADGTNVTPLTMPLATPLFDPADSHPTWSPDGSKIAFASNRSGADQLYVMNADGSGISLATDMHGPVEPAWSPDGRRIAFVLRVSGGADVYVMNVDGSGVAALTAGPGTKVDPAWSPDGTKIAFSSSSGAAAQISVMNADGSHVAQLTNFQSPDLWAGHPTWSPDGTRIAFYAGAYPWYNIWTINSDGTNPQLLPGVAGAAEVETSPAWRPSTSAAPAPPRARAR